MADEQTIYLSPEEELTSVRERLERTQARHITLVIPQQTQLRSHVGWRLIHARMRELGKELLVISPDRQVRAVARAAGFRVAETPDLPGNRSRSGGGTRPGSSGTRNGSRSRVGSSRGGSDSQPTQQRRPTPLSDKRPATSDQTEYEDESTLERPGKRSSKPRPSQPIAPALPFAQPESQFGPSYDFHIDTTPSVRPSVPPFEEDDEEDLPLKYYDHGYTEAQQIRESASQGSAKSPEKSGPTKGRRKTDPYAYMEDDQPHSRLPEQRGSLHGPVDDLGTGVPDISDYSTEIMPGEIEDLGDQGDLDFPVNRPAPEQPLMRGRQPEARPRPRTGQMQQPITRHSPRAPRPGSQDFEDDEDLLALPNRGAQPGRPSRGLGGTPARPPSRGLADTQQPRRPSQNLQPRRPSQNLQPRPSQGLRPTGAMPQTGTRARPASAPAPNRQLMSLPTPAATPRQASSPRGGQHRSRRGLTIFFGAIALLLCIAIVLFYYGPTATVTLSLQAQTVNQTVHLTAMTHPQANVPGVLEAQRLQATFSASGQGTASGTTRVGNAQAQGLVTFTNNGNADVTIPTGTIITTPSGLSFLTGAEAVIPHGNSFPAVPVNAQQSGESGNVAANSITIIPQPSVNSIAQYNKISAASINLAVNNPQATSGGGAIDEPAVTTHDLQTLTRSLHKQLQQKVTTWLGQQVHSGDLRGTPVPDVLDSPGPLAAEQLSGAPATGQAVKDGNFSGTLSVQVSVLVARASDLQKAASAQLNASALKLNPPSVLATQLPVTLANAQGTTSQDGNTLNITAQASGSIMHQIPTSLLSSSLTGKSITDATSALQTSMARAGLQKVLINVSPAFLTNLPLDADHIHIILQPIQQTPPKHVPNG